MNTLVKPSIADIAKVVKSIDPTFDLRSAFDTLMPPSADARGVATQGDVLTQTADGRSLNEIWNEFIATLGMFNEARSAIVNLLTYPVSQPIEDVPIISGDDFEEASEFGIPKTIRGGAYHTLGYDFKWYDLRIAYTWMFLAEALSSQVESMNNMAFEADNRLVFSRVMKAVFNNVNRIATIRGQAVNVYAFYNNDGTVPPAYKNYVHLSTHNHYLTSGAAAVVSADLDEMEEHLVHHGYGRQNGARLILMANRTEIAVIRNFRVATGASYDFIPAQGQPPFLLPANTGGIQGGQVGSTFQGLTVAGTYGNWLIIEEDYVPTKYLFGFASGGDNNGTNPIGFREHANASLRGLRLIKGTDSDYPLIDSYYNHGFGTGIRHRGAGVVMEITADATYDIPAAYV